MLNKLVALHAEDSSKTVQKGERKKEGGFHCLEEVASLFACWAILTPGKSQKSSLKICKLAILFCCCIASSLPLVWIIIVSNGFLCVQLPFSLLGGKPDCSKHSAFTTTPFPPCCFPCPNILKVSTVSVGLQCRSWQECYAAVGCCLLCAISHPHNMLLSFQLSGLKENAQWTRLICNNPSLHSNRTFCCWDLLWLGHNCNVPEPGVLKYSKSRS